MFAFSDSAREEATSPKYKPGTAIAVGACTSSNIGQLYENAGPGLCVNAGKGIALDSGERIILKDTPAIADTPFRDTENNVPIKTGANYIVIDKLYTGGNIFIKNYF